LERLQSEHWTPLLEWARKTYDIEIKVSNSILSVRQPAATEQKLLKAMESLDQWSLAGECHQSTSTIAQLSFAIALERATYASKSLIIALALVTKHMSVEQAALTASVEVNSQIERWGEVEDSAFPVSFIDNIT
jgi:ATP synthase F1 complex assembly factor 2